ncbi:MAG: hypothetical protein GY859_02905, partial [Desulfobacterales bacterium]|nr:hypothetical protein [Desulfobacterales bacterium]
MIVLIIFLLYLNYNSQKKLRASALNQCESEIEKRARDMGYFFSEQTRGLEDLLLSRVFSQYFENAALGMSMEYGLGFTIQEIQKRFTLFIQRRKMGEKFIYSRLAFVDMDGKPLMEAGAPALYPLGPGKGEFKLDDDAGGYYIHSRESPSRFCMLLTLPYHFKGRQVGRVIAWIIPRNVLPHYLHSPRPSKLTGLLCGQGHYLRHEFETSPGEDPEASVDGVSILSEERYARILPGTMSGRDLSFRQPIPDTAFHLVQILPSGAVFGSVHPGWLLLAMAFL